MTEDIRSKKKELRRVILSSRDALPLEEREKRSRSIHSHLFSLPEFGSAHTVALFISFRSEVLTETMIKAALALEKVVAVPFTDLIHRRLIFFRITDYTADLTPGTWGILEPKPDRMRFVPLKEFDLIVTPGVAFDCRGNRIGYGGGFYDRIIRTSEKRGIFVALAFELQVVDEVPFDSTHDRPVDILITEERVIRCRC